MRAYEFVTEKKKRRRRLKGAAWGPGPYGGYGYAVGYSGDGGGEGGVGESRTRPTGNDSPQAWIDYFLTSDHPNLKGKDPDTLKRMALAARNRAVHNPPKPKPTFKPRPQNPNVRYWWQEKDESIGEGWDEAEELKLDLDDGWVGVENTPEGVLIYGADIQLPEDKVWIEFIYNLTTDKLVKSRGHHGYNGDYDWDSEDEQELIRYVVDEVKKYYGTTWDEISDELHGGMSVDEGWKDWVGGAALGAAVATGAPHAYDAYKDLNKDEPKVVQQVQQPKSDFKKGIEKLAKDAVPKSLVTGSPHEKFLTQAAVAAGIKGEELAQFLAQTAHESHNFKSMVEYGDSKYFKKYEPRFVKNKKTKKLVQVNQKAEILGNTQRGDGERYKGRGYIQLTGKYNYAQASKALGLDLVKKPELVEKPEVAAKVAVWFWQNRVQPKVDDFGNTKSATKPINPGLKGLPDRKEKFQDFKTVMR